MRQWSPWPGVNVWSSSDSFWFWQQSSAGVPTALCPDLLRYEQIGAADGWRGRVIRAVFWLLRIWPPTR